MFDLFSRSSLFLPSSPFPSHYFPFPPFIPPYLPSFLLPSLYFPFPPFISPPSFHLPFPPFISLSLPLLPFSSLYFPFLPFISLSLQLSPFPPFSLLSSLSLSPINFLYCQCDIFSSLNRKNLPSFHSFLKMKIVRQDYTKYCTN